MNGAVAHTVISHGMVSILCRQKPKMQHLPNAFRQCRMWYWSARARAAAFIRQLRKHSSRSDAIVIMCPDADDIGSVGDAIWNGASDYLVKPYNRNIFDAKLRQTGIL